MIDECVAAVFPKLESAPEAIQRLTDGGFPSAQVSLVAVGLQEKPDSLEPMTLGDDSLHDAAIGAGFGGVLGMLTGLSVMVVSGLGVVFLAGPVGGVILGSITGAYLGTMAGYGVHEHRIKHYRQLIAAGNALVIATGDPLQLARAYRLLETTGPSELHTYARTADDSPETA